MKRTEIFPGRYYAASLSGRPLMHHPSLVKVEVLRQEGDSFRVKQHGILRANSANNLELTPRMGEASLIPHRFLCPWADYEKHRREDHEKRRKQQTEAEKIKAAEKADRMAKAGRLKDALAKVRQLSKKPLSNVEYQINRFVEGTLYGSSGIPVTPDDLLAILTWSEAQVEEVERVRVEAEDSVRREAIIDSVLDIL